VNDAVVDWLEHMRPNKCSSLVKMKSVTRGWQVLCLTFTEPVISSRAGIITKIDR